MNPIYKPKGAAAEYGDYALNIYTGCPHRCYYCFAPNVRRMDREKFHSCVEPRMHIIEETKRQLERDTTLRGKLIHLCFTCDPYPVDCDSSTTREIIKLLKEYENHVQILTKGDGSRDFDLLDGEDWYGVTFSHFARKGDEQEPQAEPTIRRFLTLSEARARKIKTWVSFEPVLNTEDVFTFLKNYYMMLDKVKIGKLNYYPSNIDWKQFGGQVEELCQSLGLDYYIKDGLRKEMEKDTP